jgi:hypothetical protein
MTLCIAPFSHSCAPLTLLYSHSLAHSSLTLSSPFQYQDVAQSRAATTTKDTKKGHYVGIHASGFKDFLLKPELLRAIVDAGFEHPSEVQHESIPQAVLGGDIVCQAKSGMGKTAGESK